MMGYLRQTFLGEQTNSLYLKVAVVADVESKILFFFPRYQSGTCFDSHDWSLKIYSVCCKVENLALDAKPS